ncbi:flagellin lysine-N-methylase [Bacillus thuringiensis]|uniref:Flagellin lysine-N-methylase n=1 Tax=Bacillus thuringiensis serovar andalousiensis TaxID=257985 RepID=A0A6H0TN49_BACTU|nr:flagellin lysine-N-methylase [Bacillus thuringiensis]QIW21380.1 flagellin lysine-N-methylase [Bacillus thuringiensis serovar andalousiensis]
MKNNFWIANYLSTFSCIGSKCEDTCCKNWKIYVDKEHYDLYHNLEDKETKKNIQQSIDRNPKNLSDDSYGIMQLTSSNTCPFLTEQNLCKIHMQYGPEALCKTCRYYPRETTKLNEEYYQTGDLSCPEMARLILLSKTNINWKRTTDTEDYHSLIKSQHEINRNYVKHVHAIFMDILSRKHHSLTKRLWLIGVFIEELSVWTQKNDKKSMKLACKKVEELQKYTPTNYLEIKMPVFIQGISNIAHAENSQAILNNRFRECLILFQEGMQIHVKKKYTLQDILKHYHNIFSKHHQPFMSSRNYILENYCRYYFMKNLFPYNIQSLVKEYLLFILHFSILQFLLIGISASPQRIGEDIIVQLFQSYSKNFEHNGSYLETYILGFLNHFPKDVSAFNKCISILLSN